jgi:hypothetical protein
MVHITPVDMGVRPYFELWLVSGLSPKMTPVRACSGPAGLAYILARLWSVMYSTILLESFVFVCR